MLCPVLPAALAHYREIATMLDSDWVTLARQLTIADRDVMRIQLDHVNIVEQAGAALRLWGCTARRPEASDLENALRHIGRLDIVRKIFHRTAAAAVEEEEGVTVVTTDTVVTEDIKPTVPGMCLIFVINILKTKFFFSIEMNQFSQLYFAL